MTDRDHNRAEPRAGPAFVKSLGSRGVGPVPGRRPPGRGPRAAGRPGRRAAFRRPAGARGRDGRPSIAPGAARGFLVSGRRFSALIIASVLIFRRSRTARAPTFDFGILGPMGPCVAPTRLATSTGVRRTKARIRVDSMMPIPRSVGRRRLAAALIAASAGAGAILLALATPGVARPRAEVTPPAETEAGREPTSCAGPGLPRGRRADQTRLGRRLHQGRRLHDLALFRPARPGLRGPPGAPVDRDGREAQGDPRRQAAPRVEGLPGLPRDGRPAGHGPGPRDRRWPRGSPARRATARPRPGRTPTSPRPGGRTRRPGPRTGWSTSPTRGPGEDLRRLPRRRPVAGDGRQPRPDRRRPSPAQLRVLGLPGEPTRSTGGRSPAAAATRPATGPSARRSRPGPRSGSWPTGRGPRRPRSPTRRPRSPPGPSCPSPSASPATTAWTSRAGSPTAGPSPSSRAGSPGRPGPRRCSPSCGRSTRPGRSTRRAPLGRPPGRDVEEGARRRRRSPSWPARRPS